MSSLQRACGILIAGSVSIFAASQTAFAVTVQFASPQDDADYTTATLPTASTSPFTLQTTGTVYFNELGSVASVYRSPFENANPGPNATYNSLNGGYYLTGAYNLPYTSVEGGGSATYTFAKPETLLEVLWGSPDSYNTLTFYSGSTLEGSITGSALDLSTYGHDEVVLELSDGATFTSVTFSSTTNAFEFADLAVSPGGPDPKFSPLAPTPLPSSWLLLLTALAGLGWMAHRRQRTASALSPA
jgi:hypothetical protein